MPDKHLSTQFDHELSNLSSRVMEMGGLVESQIRQVMYALNHFAVDVADQVCDNEARVNALDVQIDHDLSSVIARRQPAARDLRLLLAVSKVIANLERSGDEAAKIGRMVRAIVEAGAARKLPASELRVAGDLALAQLRKALDSFARLDASAAQMILREDDEIDDEFDGFVRKLITYMMEDPRTISASLDLLFVAKSIERIGDHAKNIAEAVIYVVRGEDVRHIPATRTEEGSGRP